MELFLCWGFFLENTSKDVLVVHVLIRFQDNMPITKLFDLFSSSEHACGSLSSFHKYLNIDVGIVFHKKNRKDI